MTSQEMLQQAVALIKTGDKAGGRALLIALTRDEPDNETAWTWLFASSEQTAEKKYYLEQALRVNPNNHQARQLLDQILAEEPVPSASIAPIMPSSQSSSQPYSPPPKVSPNHVSMMDSGWKRLSPDIKAGVIFGLFNAVIHIINYVSGGLGFLFTSPIALLIGLLQGMTVVRYARQSSRYVPQQYVKLAALSGVWMILFSLLVQAVLSAVLLGISLGAAVGLIPIFILMTISSTIVQIIAPIIGAWLYNRYGGAKLVIVTGGVGCGCSILLLGALVVIIGVLIGAGTQVLGPLIGK